MSYFKPQSIGFHHKILLFVSEILIQDEVQDNGLDGTHHT